MQIPARDYSATEDIANTWSAAAGLIVFLGFSPLLYRVAAGTGTRSVFLWQGRSYLRKGLEFYYTFWMEHILSKKRILELYLNHIELGTGIYGIGAASEVYFGKSPSQLTLPQMAALAAILPNPREWSPTAPNPTVQHKIRRVERLASRAPFPADKLQ